MAFNFNEQILVPYVNRTSNAIQQIIISYSANQPFYFSCRFRANWDGNDDKYIMSLQNGDADGNVFNYGIYQNRLLTWSGIYDTGTLTFQNVTRKLDLVYQGGILKVYLDNALVNTRSVSIGAATHLRVGEYHNTATADAWIGELWDWMFVIGYPEFVAPSGIIYLADGSSYTTVGDTQPSNPFINAFKYRSIYTRGYVSGGYKDVSPWRNVNRTVHTTDVTTNLGDILDQAAAYVDGSYSDYHQYIYATSPTWPGVGTYTSSINMATEAGRTNQASWNTTQSYGNYGDTGVVINGNLTMAWILGDQTIIDKHNLVTETMYAAGNGGSGVGTPGDWVCAWYGEFYGWVKHSSQGSRNHKMDFATETWSSAGLSVGTDGWGKALKTKEGYAYVKNVGNIGTSAYKINDTTGSNIRTDLNFNNAGEENYETGQNWGYCLGEYNGAQNNNTYKVTHGTDVYTVLGSTSQPKGHDGMSSAAMCSASAMMLGGL